VVIFFTIGPEPMDQDGNVNENPVEPNVESTSNTDNEDREIGEQGIAIFVLYKTNTKNNFHF
jgi:hypothetical protein